MRVLVTNDDGLLAPGLTHLAAAAAAAGHDVIAVAPASNYSGSGAAIGDLGEQSRIRCRELSLPRLDDVETIELDAPPALCVITTALEAYGPRPDVVLSGINPGLNTGRSTLHSGTVGAVLTAVNFRIPGVAVSIDGHEPEVVNWDVAADAAVRLGGWVHAARDPVTLNLSVPDRALEDMAGARIGTLAPMGAVHTEVQDRDDEWIQLGFARTETELPPDCDSRLAAEGNLVVTALHGIRAAPLEDPGGLTSLLGAPTTPVV